MDKVLNNIMSRKGYGWRRPVGRTYMYNLDVGEHYYAPMTAYLDSEERGSRGETPGALTFGERLSQKWLNGRRYEATELRERYSRASSMVKDSAPASSNSYLEDALASARSARAASEMRTSSTRQGASEMRMASSRQAASTTASSKQQLISSSIASTSNRRTAASTQRVSYKTQFYKVMRRFP